MSKAGMHHAPLSWWDTALTWMCDKFMAALFRVDAALGDLGGED